MNHSLLAGNIEDVIEKCGYTVNYALTKSQAGKDLVSNMKRSKPQFPSIEKIIRLADYLQVSLDELVGRYGFNVDDSPCGLQALTDIYGSMSETGRKLLLESAHSCRKYHPRDTEFAGELSVSRKKVTRAA